LVNAFKNNALDGSDKHDIELADLSGSDLIKSDQKAFEDRIKILNKYMNIYNFN